MDDDPILEAARSIRPYLSELVGDHDAELIDAELAELLAAAEDEPPDTALLLDRLGSAPATAEWTATFLEGGYPPAVAGFFVRTDRVGELPGHGEAPTGARKYVCPEGDFVWWRRGAEPLRRCPTHAGQALEPANGR